MTIRNILRRAGIYLGALLVVSGLHFPTAQSADSEALSPEQKKAVEEVVREYLRENPEVLVEAIRALRVKQEAQEREQAQAALDENWPLLASTSASPVMGNKEGDITVVEFFDYRCGYCKRVFPSVQKLLKDDGNVRYVLKEFPILGPQSVVAAKASLAVWQLKPEKYAEFHASLMTARGALTEKMILETAVAVGLDEDEVKETMEGPAVTEEIGANHKLAQALRITGTPAFVIGNHVVPGAVDLDTLKQLIQAARSS